MSVVILNKTTFDTLIASIRNDYPQLYEALKLISESVSSLQTELTPTTNEIAVLGQFNTKERLDAADFTANNAMTWAVPLSSGPIFEYTLIGYRMSINISLAGTTVAGVLDTTLQILIPEGYKSKQSVQVVGWRTDNGVEGVCYVYTTSGSQIISVRLDFAATTWAASAANTSIKFNISFEVM